ncbi:hypothetical protein [Clostridium thermobutyricum]|uniref:hypothetical protein n=1 Tax=Clostridium thermobutyricum TaxID=29372 RepID=UPI0018AB1B73|nr:hypothetical protein [Clostridium thermobutyricum]
MSIFLKKSRVISLCIFPIIAIVLSIFTLYSIFTTNNTANYIESIYQYQMIIFFFNIIICILFSFYYIYLGFLFDKNSNNKVYEVFKKINIIWGFIQIILEVIGVFISNGININLISPTIGIFISIFIIILQLADIYLILNYNNSLKINS